ncbi:putative cyclic nucleotide-gated ion channel 5 [Carex littledalei]|uniref:Putative cyclic nucleotide-gated ion channel 5 n=1 Tax=Carex littledalei TaxID=544730 RepID=A0A833V458_9POAL|nr:putative cyclic nucleotide-gated ion channel 5 [Carex littledalei]
MFTCGVYKSQSIDGHRERFVRLEESSPKLSVTTPPGRMNRTSFSIEPFGTNSKTKPKSFKKGVIKSSEQLRSFGRSIRYGVSHAVFAEDLNKKEKKIFDPQDKFLQWMNRLFALSCFLGVSIDPLFMYLPTVDIENNCLGIDRKLAVASTTLRTVIDSLYLGRMVLQFRTAFIAPSSRVFGRGELVIDPEQIAKRYLRRYFIVDFLSVFPLPQIVLWRYLHQSTGADVLGTKTEVIIIVLAQYIPRFLRIFPLMTELKRSSGVVAESAWMGAVYYLLWYLLASHIVGALWYFLAVEREDSCWKKACKSPGCHNSFLYCGNNYLPGYNEWANAERDDLIKNCSVVEDNTEFNFGIYESALDSGVVSSVKFLPKFFFCLWWGLQNLSTLGQGLQTSIYTVEVIFSISLAILGLILFALLIGNMQTYLQSSTIRLEEMRVKRSDSEQWMRHRLLPHDLKQRVRRYDQYKWVETRGVDEENIVQSLPKDLRRDIKRHLCLGLVRRVPLFENMDERLLDAICERLKPSLCTEHTYIVREGDPVDEMIFIIRGRLESVTTDGGRSGFYNRGVLKEGDFCGEELLTWALDPKSGSNLPSSTRTVRALTEVEAFALIADELKFVASQFRRLHSKQVQHTFRFYSQQWRTWAACYIQAAWRRFSKRKAAEIRRREEMEDSMSPNTSSSLGATIYASRFAANALKGLHRIRSMRIRDLTIPVPRPPEPDFGIED